jgi:FlaA1/EpsC-like NDP-sugar epimerase
MLVRDLTRMYRDRYEVVGFLDDNPAKRGLRIHDALVLGPVEYLGDFVPRYQVDEVIIAIPTATGEAMR